MERPDVMQGNGEYPEIIKLMKVVEKGSVTRLT